MEGVLISVQNVNVDFRSLIVLEVALTGPHFVVSCYANTWTSYFGNFLSPVTIDKFLMIAVAMMKRSAGSLWCQGRLLDFMAASEFSGSSRIF